MKYLLGYRRYKKLVLFWRNKTRLANLPKPEQIIRTYLSCHLTYHSACVNTGKKCTLHKDLGINCPLQSHTACLLTHSVFTHTQRVHSHTACSLTQRVYTQHVYTQRVYTQRVYTQRVDTQRVDTQRVYTACLHSVFTQRVHTACSHSVFTQRVHTACSHSVFTQRVHTACSHSVFTQRVHTGRLVGQMTAQIGHYNLLRFAFANLALFLQNKSNFLLRGQLSKYFKYKLLTIFQTICSPVI